MREAKLTEYTEIHNYIRQMYDNRMKVFNFAIVFNAALVVVVLQHLQQLMPKVSVSIFAILATLLFLGIERRSTFVLDTFVEYGIELEYEIKMCLLRKAYGAFLERGLPLKKWQHRKYYLLLYCLITILWLFLIGYFVYQHLSNPQDLNFEWTLKISK